jgi:hypothetical protein
MMKHASSARIFARALSIALALACPFTATAHAAKPTKAQQVACEISAGQLPPPKLVEKESAVELEIDAADSVLALMTTTTGTVRGIWPAGQVLTDIPKDLFDMLKDAYPDLSPLDVPWEVLSAEEQRRLLKAAAPLTEWEFFQNRRVKGLIYKEIVTLTFTKPTRFAGKIYPAGTHKIPSKEIFGNTVIEYMGPKRMRENLGFELHIRSRYSAGDNMITARNLSLNLIGRISPLHLHITGPYPAESNAHEALRMMGAYQNFMMVHDLLLMERKGTIDSNSDGFYAYDGYAARDFYNAVKSGLAWDQIQEIHSKMGTIGLRNHTGYDDFVWGIESRYLSPSISDARLYMMLNQIQDKMISGELTSALEQAKRYSAFFFGNPNIKNALMKNVADSLHRGRGMEDWQVLEAHQKNAMTLYLFQNFSTNYEFFGNKKLLEQITQAQEHCIELLKRGMNSTDVMELFARKSGLRHYFSQKYPGVFP